MKPSSLRIRAISRLVREAGTTTSVWRARDALRTRVSMSAIGSEMFMQSLPARLGDARELALEGSLAEADAAQGEPAHECTRPAAHEAPVIAADAELRRPLCLCDQRFLGHSYLPRAYEAKGMPRSLSRRFDSSSDFAVVTMLTSSPRRRSTLS